MTEIRLKDSSRAHILIRSANWVGDAVMTTPVVRTSLSKAFALIGALNLFVTNNSGLMHAAAAQNVNQVAVIWSTDHIATAPANKNSVMVRQPVPCSPCMKKEGSIDLKCMEKITVDMVMAACSSFLEKEGFNG